MEEFVTEITLFLGFYITMSFYLFMTLLFKPNEKKWKGILEPDYYEASLRTTKNSKGASFREKGAKKTKIHNKIDKLVKRKEWDRKLGDLYRKGGNPGRNYEYFVLQNLKYLTMGFLLFSLSYAFLGNLLVSFGLLILISSLHIIDIHGDISDRKKEFRSRFPFFLQTLAFVLENGSNLNMAFKDVVEKEQPGTLKSIMKEVQNIWKVNGGDFVEAFKHIVVEVEIDETREFVDIIQNNAEKGIPIAKTLGLQSKTMANFINNKKMKKVNSVENKVIVPLLLSFVSIGIFLYFGLTF